jgi:peptide chain release factor 3
MNKCDRPTRDPIALIDEVETVLGLAPVPITWPLGNGPSFRGVYDLRARQVHLFERVPGGKFRAPVDVADITDPRVREKLDAEAYASSSEQLEMLEGAGHLFDLAAVQAGRQTPVFFGSAVNNFGVQLLLEGFLRDSIPPQPRRNASVLAVNGTDSTPAADDAPAVETEPAATGGDVVPIVHPKFSAFVFKIQANMDPKHRDRIAFVRVCSGKFTRDMTVVHQRTGRTVRLSSSHKLFGQERETVDEAWPGDVIGLVGHDAFGIGDTLTEDKAIRYDEIPRFPPEVFAYLSNPSSSDAKRYRAGLEQLLQEGVVQSFTVRHGPPGATLLAAVGPLQFEVVQYRLKAEYNAESRLVPAPFEHLRWIEPHPSLATPDVLLMPGGVSLGTDKFDHPVVLFPNDWTMSYFLEKNPELNLHALPIEQV